ncbi:MAG: hypothetical protein ACTHU0_19145 [Kofleriaceae bacterium]
MAILPNTGVELPTLGGDSGTWGQKLNAALSNYDEHDHTAGRGKRLKVSAMFIDADLPFGGFGPTGLGHATFSAITPLTSGARRFFVSSTDGELYFRSASGVNIKFTAGNALNVAAFTGGIGGDYTAVGALAAYDNSNSRYTFRGPGSIWARLASGEVRVYETGTTETVYVGIAAPSALAASYAITLPLAPPASTSLVQMSATGALTASNTVSTATTFSAAVFAQSTLSVDGASTLTGAVTAKSTVDAVGLITAQAGLTAFAGQHVTISGAANYRHGTKSITRALTKNTPMNIQAGTVSDVGGSAGIAISSNTIVYFPLPELPSHARLVAVTVYFPTAPDRDNVLCKLYQTSASDPATTAFSDMSIILTSSGFALRRAAGLSFLPSGSQTYWVQVSNSTSTPKMQAIVVEYDVP